MYLAYWSTGARRHCGRTNWTAAGTRCSSTNHVLTFSRCDHAAGLIRGEPTAADRVSREPSDLQEVELFSLQDCGDDDADMSCLWWPAAQSILSAKESTMPDRDIRCYFFLHSVPRSLHSCRIDHGAKDGRGRFRSFSAGSSQPRDKSILRRSRCLRASTIPPTACARKAGRNSLS